MSKILLMRVITINTMQRNGIYKYEIAFINLHIPILSYPSIKIYLLWLYYNRILSLLNE